jgi:hypothetical protein
MPRSIIAQYVGLVLPGDLPTDVLEAVRNLAVERGADYALVRSGPQETLLFLHRKTGKLAFNSGLDTLGNILGTPVRKLDLPSKKPMNFFLNRYPQGVPRQMYIDFSGDTFSPESLERLSTRTTRLMDPTVRLSTLVENGELEMADVSNIANARGHLTQEEKDWASDHLPDLEGPVTVRYRKHVDGEPVPDGPFKDVTFVGRPNDLMAKRKHYWVYSGPGYGKTTTTRLELLDKYKAAIVPHPNNAVNVSDQAHLLIFDEIGPTR